MTLTQRISLIAVLILLVACDKKVKKPRPKNSSRKSSTSDANNGKQDGFGYIEGIVRNAVDKQPSVVTITVKNNGTEINSLKSGLSGKYRVKLPAGEYRLEFADKLFSTSIRRHVLVRKNKSTIIDQSVSRKSSTEQKSTSWEWRVVLNWTAAKQNAVQDIDSYISVPNEQPVYYEHKNSAKKNVNLDVDVTTWRGPETITVRKQSGVHSYYVNNFDNRRNKSALANSAIHIELHRAFNDGVYRTYDIYPDKIIVVDETDEIGIAIGDERVVPLKGKGLTIELFQVLEDGTIKDILKYNGSLPTSKG